MEAIAIVLRLLLYLEADENFSENLNSDIHHVKDRSR